MASSPACRAAATAARTTAWARPRRRARGSVADVLDLGDAVAPQQPAGGRPARRAAGATNQRSPANCGRAAASRSSSCATVSVVGVLRPQPACDQLAAQRRDLAASRHLARRRLRLPPGRPRARPCRAVRSAVPARYRDQLRRQPPSLRFVGDDDRAVLAAGLAQHLVGQRHHLGDGQSRSPRSSEQAGVPDQRQARSQVDPPPVARRALVADRGGESELRCRRRRRGSACGRRPSRPR